MSFVHIHTHSEYSMLDGAARVDDLIAQAVAFGMPALAITDHGYMYGAVRFYKEASKAGIKPVIGCEVYFMPERQLSGGKPDLSHLLLLAKDNEGYKNLMALVSDAAVSGFYYKPQVDLETLKRFSGGLIGTSACMSGIVSKSIERGEPDKAKHWAETFASVFAPGDFYLEVQEQGIVASNGVSQTQLNAAISQIAGELGLPLVGTNDIHYLTRKDAETQDLLLCIGTGSTIDQPGRMKFSCDEFYMKSQEEMAQALKAYPEALSNTLEIAEKCNVEMDFGRIILPAFDVPQDETEASYLRKRCIEGLKVRYGDPIPEHVMERLDTELAVIIEKGFPAYFLIVSDFTQWAKDNGIGVGPGRGSAAGSIVSYALSITNLDPLENGLLFERFLNPERTEMPDIDMDFDDERRNDVIDYVRGKYGAEKVAQIITFGTMKARAAIRDAGRVLGYPYGVPDKISKMIVDDLKAGIKESLDQNPDLKSDYQSNPDTKRIIDAARSIEGIVRNEGIHAAGVVICPDPLHEHLPVKKDTKGGVVITQYDGPTVAELGLLKMDFLGLRTLTVIAGALKAIKANHGIDIDIETIPMDDAATWELLARGDTDGVFQVESPGMKNTLKQLKPTVFGDIVAVVALYRPGPMDSIPDFIARKHGRAAISYYDERIKHILEDTYGAMVYQEQVMLISMEMAGFSAAKAEKLRKGMGKKIKEVIDALKVDFVGGAVERGYDKKLAEQVYADIEKFAQYAFNKSHAAAYGLISYQTAYLKAHYPLDYMASVLTSYTGRTEKIVHYVAACHRAGISVLPPDVNSSGTYFKAVDGAIRFGLAGIRGVGEGMVDAITEAREQGGKFTSLADFCLRVDMKQVNKKTLESLIKGGAFDSTGYTRKHLMGLMDACVESAAKRQRDQASGQVSMFDMFAAEDDGFAERVEPPNGDEWDRKMLLAFEKEMLGIYVSDHPLREIEQMVRANSDYSLGDVEEIKDQSIGWFTGMLSSVERRATKRGAMMATARLEDLDGSIETVFFPSTFEKYRELIVDDSVVRIKGRVEESDRGTKLMVLELEPFDGAEFSAPPRKITVRTDAGALRNGRAETLKDILTHFPGRDRVELEVWDEASERFVISAMPHRVNADASGLFAELMELFGSDAITSAA
jgi:DNA polymerase-3 subunit alpha